MRLLFDTHTFLWWANEPAKLSSRVLSLCQDPSTDLILSIASIWEMQIKAQLGKLSLPMSLQTLIAQHQENGLQLLPIVLSDVLALDALPLHHKDPFDRILIAQSIHHKIPIASADALFDNYPVTRIW